MTSQFVKLLKEWRAANGYTQEQAAAAMEVSVYTLRNWEAEHRRPQGLSLKTVLRTILPEGHPFELKTSTQEAAKTDA